jgi:hypothetical protein
LPSQGTTWHLRNDPQQDAESPMGVVLGGYYDLRLAAAERS